MPLELNAILSKRRRNASEGKFVDAHNNVLIALRDMHAVKQFDDETIRRVLKPDKRGVEHGLRAADRHQKGETNLAALKAEEIYFDAVRKAVDATLNLLKGRKQISGEELIEIADFYLSNHWIHEDEKAGLVEANRREKEYSTYLMKKLEAEGFSYPANYEAILLGAKGAALISHARIGRLVQEGS